MASLGHSRASSVASAATHSMASPGAFGHPSGPSGRREGDPPSASSIPHIDDILAAPRNIDETQPIRKLLESAEASLRQAEMAREFRRPAIALQEYIRASVIAIQTIRNHRDYTFLKNDRADLTHAHTALLSKISQQDSVYNKIKQDIIADNKRSGVQPRTARPGSSQGSSRAQSPAKPAVDRAMSPLNQQVNGTSTSSSPARTKPVVQPKPQSLHGNAIKPGSQRGFGVANNAAQDLAARFANLRGPQPSPGQDPRIKTHQIPLPKPMGPRDMPPPRPPKVELDTNVPILPKMPDAIYSPARGSISGEVPRPPSSTPRNMYGRAASSASIPGTPTASSQSQSDYFAPTQSYSNNSIPPVPPGNPTNPIKIPTTEYITPEELYQAMKAKGTILIIDTRVRDDFNEGHIMSSSTICIEPSILLRDNPSADQISESLVLSPNQEQSLFERRDVYDLVVFYDQDSAEIPKHPRSSDDLVIVSLHQALVHFNYMKDLRNPPKILKGGIEAWIDLMGPASLQSNTSAASRPAQISRSRNQTTAIERRRSKYLVKPLKPDEVRAWQETLKNDDMQTASSPSFLRTTEDFLRRFPPVAVEQESMTSPDQPHPQPRPVYGLSHKVDLYTDLPSPPTRPAPALPRPSYSGLSEGGDESELYGNNNAPATARLTRVPTAKAMEQQSTGEATKFYTGLNNPHNWCYANSTLQSLLASPEFGRELANSGWITRYQAPRKEDEKIDHPQLMIRIISNLFHWMSSGKFQVMKAQTLMNYSRHLCDQSRSIEQFGGSQQQDAQEFMSFILTHLHDETNTRRDRKGKVEQPNTSQQSLLQAAAEYWYRHLEFNRSIVDRYWRGLELSTVECLECHTRTYRFSPFEWIPVTVGMGRGMTLEQVLDQHTAGNTLDDFSCDHCRRPTRALQSLSLARLPPLLCVVFRRFHYQQATSDLRKSTAPITWDFNDTDFTRYFLPPADRVSSSGADPTDMAFAGPFRYEAYAVIVHTGSRIDNGHYLAYVRDSSSHDPYAWYCCNDSRVTKVRIGSGDRDDVQEEVFKSGRDRVPYLVFFRRKGMR
ncbi:ubiquitin carboxyl-terminal hydrolase [Fusarium albosuccineum]|uniref:Ubiquitin carboxyl-terminal hydrolase n=2 Tax=Fusarium decemcellulare species complex TaxID=1329916 RepID=A0A8H4L2D7_9HYPO|nr:ubiquitin carboxyl-terminal hydrolase [Fusarium albosuccineum]